MFAKCQRLTRASVVLISPPGHGFRHVCGANGRSRLWKSVLFCIVYSSCTLQFRALSYCSQVPEHTPCYHLTCTIEWNGQHSWWQRPPVVNSLHGFSRSGRMAWASTPSWLALVSLWLLSSSSWMKCGSIYPKSFFVVQLCWVQWWQKRCVRHAIVAYQRPSRTLRDSDSLYSHAFTCSGEQQPVNGGCGLCCSRFRFGPGLGLILSNRKNINYC